MMQVKSIKEGQLYQDQSFAKKILFGNGDDTVLTLHFLPGQSLPAHKHSDWKVYLLVLQGQATCHVNGEMVLLSEWDVLQCDGQDELSIKNEGKVPLSVYVMLRGEGGGN